MKVKGTYFQNNPNKPLVYGEVAIINPLRRRLRSEPEKKGILAETVLVGFCGTDLELMRMGGRKISFPENFPKGRMTADERFDGVKVPAQRLTDTDLTRLMPLMKDIESKGMFLSIDLADGDIQTENMKEIIEECPQLRIAIGHFGMITRPRWTEQIKLARNKNVFIESGGIQMSYNFISKTPELTEKGKTLFLGDTAEGFYNF